MKNKLLATVGMTVVIGCTSFAVAQNREGGATQSQGAQQHQMGNPGGAGSPGGAMSTPSGGNESSTSGPQGSGERGKSFSQEERNKSSTKSTPQGSAQEQRGPQNQRGAQEQRGKEDEQRGAQNQRGTEQRGAQDNDRAGTQERMGQDRGKAVPGQAQQNGTSGRAGGASVQLSQDQRTKVKDVIVRDRNVARVNSANFSVSVGAKVPRDVHVSVLPPEVVTIVPEYRGFEYVMVGDQLLIIDPNTLEIVAVLPA